jgi:hypothetical protein
MNNLDLNINNYSSDQLKQLFNIRQHDILNESLLNSKKEQYFRMILNDKSIEQNKVIKIINFITNAIDHLNQKNTFKHNYGENLNVQMTHPIVSKPDTPFIYSNPSVAFEGIVNPLERRINSSILSIDTVFRENYKLTNSNKSFFMLKNPLFNVISMKLVSLELPRMWDIISEENGNNMMKIELYNMPNYPNSIQTIILPNGHYTNADLVSCLNNYFNNSGNGLEYLMVIVDPKTSKIMISTKNPQMGATANPSIFIEGGQYYSSNFYFILDFTESCAGLGKYLGFDDKKYKVDINSKKLDLINYIFPVEIIGYVEGNSSCGIIFDNYIYVNINDFNKNFNSNGVIGQTDNSLIGNNILGRITLNAFPDTLLINNNSDRILKKREYYGPVRIRQLEVSLTNKYGKLINLLNNDYSLTLEFEILYS